MVSSGLHISMVSPLWFFMLDRRLRSWLGDRQALKLSLGPSISMKPLAYCAVIGPRKSRPVVYLRLHSFQLFIISKPPRSPGSWNYPSRMLMIQVEADRFTMHRRPDQGSRTYVDTGPISEIPVVSHPFGFWASRMLTILLAGVGVARRTTVECSLTRAAAVGLTDALCMKRW